MPWTRLRARWRDLLAPSVAGRVDAHMAGYRQAYERRGRAWLTLDGDDVASFCEFAYANAWRDEGRRGRATGSPFTDAARARVRATGLRDKSDLLDAMGACIGGPIDELLESPDPLVRALAMLDRRLGKRRLARVQAESEHPLVTQMHRLRCGAEATLRQA